MGKELNNNNRASVLGKFDASIPGFLENPYYFYQQLREAQPIYWEQHPTERWILTRYEDVASALHNPALIKPGPDGLLNRLPADIRKKVIPLELNLSLDMLNQNPPDHTRLRSLVSQAFTPKRIEELRPYIETVAGELINNFIHAEEFDVIHDFSSQLPAFVILKMLGVPKEDRAQIGQWSHDISDLFGAARFGTDPITTSLQATQSSVEFQKYMRALIHHHVRHDQDEDSLLTSLLYAKTEGNMLTEAEIISNCMLLIGAGQETTTHAIGNGLLALLKHPDQLQLLRGNPNLIKNAVEELLRYDTPAQMLVRIASDDTFINSQKITAGQFVFMSVGAANRDPEQFTRPDELDITRAKNQHSSFGFGIHFCLGAPLARTEMEVGLQSLIHGRLTDLQQVHEKPDWSSDVDLRGLKSFSVRFKAKI